MKLLFALICGIVAAGRGAAAEPVPPNEEPPFQDVLRLIRAHLEGVTEAELNQALTRGLLDHFHSRVVLATNVPGATGDVAGLVVRTQVFDGAFGYLRVGRVEPGLAAQFQAAWDALSSSNRLRGLVLDLRFADGTDYRAAGELAERFASVEKVLLRWDDVEVRSAPGTNVWRLPTVALLNAATSGAAEALAAALREAGPVLLVGRPSAGHGFAARSFPLGDRRELRIATAAVTAGDHVPLDVGVTPDIAVDVTPDQDRFWMDDPFRVVETELATAVTNRARPRITEADLVRRREGGPAEPGPGERPRSSSVTAAPEPPRPPSVQDLTLARALDLLKGLSVMGRAAGR